MNDASLRGELREALGEAYDLERLAARVATGRATPRDLVGPGRHAGPAPEDQGPAHGPAARIGCRELEAAIELCPEVRSSIEAALVDDPPLTIKEGGLIRDGYHPDARRACEIGLEGGQVVDRPVPGRADPPHRDRRPEGRLQQGLRLLHRDHPRPGPARRGPRRLHPQADRQERRALLSRPS